MRRLGSKRKKKSEVMLMWLRLWRKKRRKGRDGAPHCMESCTCHVIYLSGDLLIIICPF